MKKLISILLSVLLLLSFPSMTAFAANNGPSTYHETWGDTDYYQAYLRAYGPDSRGIYFTEGPVYNIFTQNTVQKTALSRVSYDLATNTLTLNNTAGTPEGKLDFITNMMGDDFTIKVIGNCEAAAITLWGWGYGANLTITGNGTLTVNKKKDFDYGIFVYSEGTKPLITFGDAVKVNLYGKVAASAIIGTPNDDITKTYVFQNGQDANVTKAPYSYENKENILALEYHSRSWDNSENRVYREGDTTGIYTMSKWYRGEDPTDIFYKVTKYLYVAKYDAYVEDNEALKDHPKSNNYGELEYTPEEWDEQTEFSLRTVTSGEAESIVVYSADDTNRENPLYYSRIKRTSDPQGNYEYHGYTSYDINDNITFDGYEISRILSDSVSGAYVTDDTFESILITKDELENSTEWIPVCYEKLTWSGYFNRGYSSVMKDSSGKKYVVNYSGEVFTFSDDYTFDIGDKTYYLLTATNAVSADDLTESIITVTEEGLYTYTINGNAFVYTGDGIHTHYWDNGVVTKKATPTATGVKTYTCTLCGKTKTEIIAKTAKYANTLTAKGNTVTVKKNKKAVIKKAKAFTIKNAKGTVTFKKSKGDKKITVAKNGNITVKKGLKKGTYKVKIKVSASGNAKYKAAVKTVTVTIRVK